MNSSHVEKGQPSNPIATRGGQLVGKLLCLLCFSLAIACGGGGSCEGKGPFMEGSSISVSVEPEHPTMVPGETKTLHLTFLPGTDGTFPIRCGLTGLTVTPPTFDITFHGKDPVTQDVVINAPLGTPSGTYDLEIGDQLDVYRTVHIVVSDGTPDFAITATPTEVSAAPNGMSEKVTFTVSSVNGFSGPVKITWVADGGASPSPNDNDFTGTVTPSTPYKFELNMYRYATYSTDIPIVFNATDIPFTKQHSVTINVKEK
jgi:hypothetical protein